MVNTNRKTQLGKYQSKNDNRELRKLQVGEVQIGKTSRRTQFGKNNSENIIQNTQVEKYNSEKTIRKNTSLKIQNGKYNSEDKI